MILLPAQFQLLVYHLIAGWMTGFSYQFEHAVKQHIKTQTVRHLIDFIWVTLCTLSFYYGLYCLNGGCTQFYCLCFFGIGFFIYIKFYFNTLRPLTKPITLFFTTFSLVFSRFFCIINMRKKKRRALFGTISNKKDKTKKGQRACCKSN